MKSLTYAVLCLAALIGSALAHPYLPKGGLELRTLPRASDAEFAVMREEALGLVAEDAALELDHLGERYFMLSHQGQLLLLVDNSATDMLVIHFSPAANKRLIPLNCSPVECAGLLHRSPSLNGPRPSRLEFRHSP